MKSVVEFLINELLQNKLLALRYDKDNVINEIIAKANEMHKQEIIEAYDAGLFDGSMDDVNDRMHKQYYLETFKKD